MERTKLLAVLVCIEITLGFIPWSGYGQSKTMQSQNKVDDYTAPQIEDFYINNTRANQTCQWAFKVSDNRGLGQSVFGCNDTGTFSNESAASLSGTAQWVNYTRTLNVSACVVSFQLWIWDIDGNCNTTGLRYMKIYVYDATAGAWNTPYPSLGSAIADVEAHNNWTSVETYAQVILDQAPVSSLDTLLTNYATTNAQEYIVNGSDYSGPDWSNPASAVDSNLATSASYSISANSNSTWLTINLTRPVHSTTGSYLVSQNSSFVGTMYVGISNFTGVWTDIYYDTPTYGTLTNFTFAQSEFSAIKFAFVASLFAGTVYVNETWIYNVAEPDWASFLKWGAYCNKLGIMNAHQTEIVNCLGNFTMVQNLPYTATYAGSILYEPGFGIPDKWALYGYYWANQYSTSLSRWNATAAFSQFNTSVYDSLNNNRPGTPKGYPIIAYPNGLGEAYGPRAYDETASTLQDYLLFAELLNDSSAMDEALKVWNHLNVNYWNATGQYYKYQLIDTGNSFECEAPFFLKIISQLKYYSPALGNWSNVLTDIRTRFLSNKWNSCQWLDGYGNSTFSVVHKYDTNQQRRLQNTLAAWQAMIGAYTQLDSTLQYNFKDMLCGNVDVEPAWALLLSPTTNLFDNATKLFKWTTGYNSPTGGTTSYDATAFAEILMFMMGIVPTTTTLAFPLEELSYEYVNDIDPTIMQFHLNAAMHEILVPIADSGTLTFQYGESPTTCNFNESGVWQVTFSNSWNVVTSVTRKSGLPTNLIYFIQTTLPDVAVTSVTPSKTIIGKGCNASIRAIIENYGIKSTGPFNVTIYAGSIAIHSEMTASTRTSWMISFTWNPTQFAYGNYAISAYAEPILGEQNVSNNNFTCPNSVHVGIPGDVSSSAQGNCEGTVNMTDIQYMVDLFNTNPTSLKWNPNADVNGDAVCNMRDIAIGVLYLNQHE